MWKDREDEIQCPDTDTTALREARLKVSFLLGRNKTDILSGENKVT